MNLNVSLCAYVQLARWIVVVEDTHKYRCTKILKKNIIILATKNQSERLEYRDKNDTEILFYAKFNQ